eukprot:TRINITY_DN2234_c0_g3_i5.p1 TRINITY_DN2234_c0_g3~~TRINITY_DN2234_c0_g3_i5.p1  ORF type:complete len:265 (-),score=29.29 TRINITY_DN2234_c0_g3_i5:315-1109(-)
MGKGVSKEVHDNVVADLEKTRKMLQNLTSHYDSVKIFHDSFIKTQTLPQTTNMVLLLGPKGAGKTTFLALRGAPVMPFTDERGIVFLDSIGIGFDTRGMSKLMAYFMLTRFPSSVVSFCGARSERDYQYLTSWYQIVDPYLCEINAQRFNSDHQHPKRNPSKDTARLFYENYFCPDDECDIYPKKGMAKHVTHLDVIEDNRGSFATMRGILCNGIFPDQTISADLKYEGLFKFQVFEQMKKLKEMEQAGTDFEKAVHIFFNTKE